MVKCSAYLCESTTYGNIPGLTFHRFPKDQTLSDIWVANLQIKNWKPSKTCVLCSKHFEEHFIDKSPFRTRLRPGAVPTLFEVLLESSEINAGGSSSSRPTPSDKKRKLDDDSDYEDHDSDLEDEYDVWAKECALELREMDQQQQIFAKEAITYILREGRMGLLQRNSVQVNNKVLYEQTALKDYNEPSMDEFLVIRKGNTKLSSLEVAAPSTTSHSYLGSGSQGLACHETVMRSSPVKSTLSLKTGDLSLIAESRKTACTVGSPSDDIGSSFVVASHKTITPISSSSSLVQTIAFGDSSSSVVVYQEITAPNRSFSMSFNDGGGVSKLQNGTEPEDSQMLLIKSEPYDDTGTISLLASRENAASGRSSSSLVKSELNSPPSSPDFTVVIKEESVSSSIDTEDH